MSDDQPTNREPMPRTERPAGWRARNDGTVSCPVCGDTTWVEVVTPTGTVGVRPCDRCKPDTYRRWTDGHYRKDT